MFKCAKKTESEYLIDPIGSERLRSVLIAGIAFVLANITHVYFLIKIGGFLTYSNRKLELKKIIGTPLKRRCIFGS